MVPGFAARLQAVVQLLLWCGVSATTGFLEVVTPGTLQTVCLNDNVTISCKVPGFPKLDSKFMGMRWYRQDHVSEAEDKVLELSGDNKSVARAGAEVSPERLPQGDASLPLRGVQPGEAGEYRCRLVVPPQMAEGRVSLEVLAMPTSRVFLEQTKRKGKDKHLICHSIGFYPEAINITWEKWTQKFSLYQKISTDVCTGPIIKNEDGIFSITSHLKLNTSTEDSGTIYSCVVWHKSLHTCQRLNYTWQVELSVRESENMDYTWILAFSFIGVMVFLSYILTRCCLCKPTLNSDIEEVSGVNTEITLEAKGTSKLGYAEICRSQREAVLPANKGPKHQAIS